MTDEAALAQAEQQYAARDWAGALTLYAAAAASDTAASLAAYHCQVELSDLAALPALEAPPPGAVGSDRLIQRLDQLLERAIELCRAREFLRATMLLRGAARHERIFNEIYRDDIDATAGPPRAWWPEPTPFLTEGGIAHVDPERAKTTFQARKVLNIAPRLFKNHPQRAHEPVDNLMVSALRFGLDYRELDLLAFGNDRRVLVAEIGRVLEDWRPDLVLVENLAIAHRYLSAANEPEGGLQNALFTLLKRARTRGSRVAGMYSDAWLVRREDLFRELGDAVDVVHHMHPGRLAADAAERAHVFCYPYPFLRPSATLAANSIPRFCFVGSVAVHNVPRAVWWSELGRRGAPVDFHESHHAAAAQRSDRDYVNLLHAHLGAVNFARRRTGVPILTGRSAETLIAGGLLIEEANPDTAYFFEPDRHYLEFDTLDGLLALLEKVAADPQGHAGVRAAGHAWARHYFSGDYFWAGLFAKAFG